MLNRHIHLNLFLRLQGNHIAGWRHPDNQIERVLDPAYYIEIARAAEAAKYDSIFIADGLALIDQPWKALSWLFEPMTLLGALSSVTQRIGLIGTVSTTYSDPFTVARAFASLDHLSRGRSGWNIVTTNSAHADANFGGNGYLDHSTRYDRAAEFVDVVRGLWDSWETDALVSDRASGILADYSKIHTLDHAGKYFKVKGPLTSPRPPQGYPVLVQAGASASGQAFAGKYADAIYAPGETLEATLAFATNIRNQARKFGREPAGIKILSALCPVLAETEQKARETAAYLSELGGVDHVYTTFKTWFGVDLSSVGPDDQIASDLLPQPETVEGFRSRYEELYGLITKESYTIRKLGGRLEGSNDGGFFVGTPEQLADRMEQWWRAGAADGFNLSIPFYDEPFQIFNSEVLPILRRRGLFREDYEEATLKERYAVKT